MTEPPTLARRLDVGNRLGECVLWDDRTQTAHWTDIEAATFWSWRFGADAPTSAPLAGRLASFALTDTPGRFFGAFAKEFALFAPAGGEHSPLAPVEPDDPATMMNDGRVDRTGTFWASSKMVDPDDASPRGQLWRLDEDTSITPFLGHMRVPNGLAWSCDGRIMYLSDSESRVIWRFAFDPENGPSRPSVFAIVEQGKPDGACIDAQDYLWVAHWGAGRVVRYRPDGSVAGRIEVPSRHPTCVAFGGPRMNYLFVTSERPNVGANAEDGCLMLFRTECAGLAESRCDGGRFPAAQQATRTSFIHQIDRHSPGIGSE